MKLKRKISLFIVYFILFIALTSMIDYYAYDTISPWVFIVISAIGALWATLAHAKSHQKTKADELAHDIEEIL